MMIFIFTSFVDIVGIVWVGIYYLVSYVCYHIWLFQFYLSTYYSEHIALDALCGLLTFAFVPIKAVLNLCISFVQLVSMLDPPWHSLSISLISFVSILSLFFIVFVFIACFSKAGDHSTSSHYRLVSEQCKGNSRNEQMAI